MQNDIYNEKKDIYNEKPLTYIIKLTLKRYTENQV